MRSFCFFLGCFANFLLFANAFNSTDQHISSIGTSMITDQNMYPSLCPRLQKVAYEKWQLANGMSLLFVHDPEASQCGIGLLVHAGSSDDPLEHRGTAHFVEHMLAGRSNADFSGGINEYVMGQGGVYNASTYVGHTTYRIALSNELFEGAVQRLFAMLRNPSFLPEETAPELTAVDEEYHIHKSQDGFLIWSAILSQLDSRSSLKDYHCGNKETLKNINAEALKQWFTDHYSWENSTCVVLSSRSLTEMREIVLPLAESLPIHTKWARPSQRYSQTESRFIFTETFQGTNALVITWPLISDYIPEKQHPLFPLCYLVAAKNSKSLCKLLNSMGLAEDCEANIETCGRNNPTLCNLEIKLTDKGVQNWESVMGVVERFLLFCSHLDKEEMEHIMDVAKKGQILEYQYRNKMTPFQCVSQQIMDLAQEPIATFPSQSYIMKDYDHGSFVRGIKDLMRGKKIVVLASPFEKWKNSSNGFLFKTPHHYEDLQVFPKWEHRYFATRLEENITPSNVLFLTPSVDSFMPEEIPQPHSVPEEVNWQCNPKKLEAKDHSTLYLQQDAHFGIPKDHFVLRIHHPEFQKKNPWWHLCSEVWMRMVNKTLEELEYLAAIGGNHFSLGPKLPKEIAVSISAWESVSLSLIRQISQQMLEKPLIQESFERIIEEMGLDVIQQEHSIPFVMARKVFLETIYDVVPSLEERKDFLSKVAFSDILEFSKTFLPNASFSGTYLGQKMPKDLQPHINELKRSFPGTGTPISQDKFTGLKVGLHRHNCPSSLSGQAARLAIDCGSSSSALESVCSWILGSGLDSIVMNQLREEEELGYAARAGWIKANNRLFLIIAVQSTKVDCSFLYLRYKQLLEDLLAKMGSDSFFHQNKFEMLKMACIEDLSAPHRSPLAFAERIYTLGVEHDEQWSFYEEMVSVAKALTFEQFKEFCAQKLHKDVARELLIAIEGQLEQ